LIVPSAELEMPPIALGVELVSSGGHTAAHASVQAGHHFDAGLAWREEQSAQERLAQDELELDRLAAKL
jgi:hypothetical protein